MRSESSGHGPLWTQSLDKSFRNSAASACTSCQSWPVTSTELLKWWNKNRSQTITRSWRSSNQAKIYTAIKQRERFDQIAARALNEAKEYWNVIRILPPSA